MNKLLLSSFLSFSVFFNIIIGSEISSNTFLFCLKPELQPLQISLNRSELSVGMEELDALFRNNNVIHIEKWIKSSNDTHKQGEIYINKIYRAYLSNEIVIDASFIIDAMNHHDFILYAEPEYSHSIYYEPNDPAYNSQCSLESVKADLAWDYWDIMEGEIPSNEKIL